MRIRFETPRGPWIADLAQPHDLAIPLRDGLQNPNCFWAPAVEFAPVVAGGFVGSTAEGGPVNFFNVRFNPHGNGTHTECLGHIARERHSLNDCLRDHHCVAQLLSLYPQQMPDGDRIVLPEQIGPLAQDMDLRALVLRTLPNDPHKRQRQYSGSNPPYLHPETAALLADAGIEHLLLDLPSVDREEDGGQLLAHRAFWRYPAAPRHHCSITELIFVPDALPDGFYLLNLQTAAFDLDAAPARPVLYALHPAD
jgi:kynurenine formamidase